MAPVPNVDRDLPPDRVKQLVESGGAQVIDVREDYEWEAGRMPGAAHITLEQLPVRAAEIDKDRPVIFVCRVGNRSAFATEAFRNGGYDAYNLSGGVTAWADAGLPLEPDGGTVAGH
jgi:rhodanese-related sulfurtransferase